MRAFSKVYGIVAVLVVLATTGCLRKEVTHTVYVSPAGLTWSVIERDVRSDHAEPPAKMAEEQDYILGARAGRHPVALALRSLGATRVDTTILRSDRPFTVVTDARFMDPGELARALLRQAHVRGDATIERDGCERTLRVWIDVDADQGEHADETASALLDGLSTYRIVLTEGRFLRADGFRIEEDGVVATPHPDVEPVDGILRVSLTWSEGC